VTKESLYAELKRTNSGHLDRRAKAWNHDTRLLKNGKNNTIPNDQKKLSDFITSIQLVSF